MTLLRIKTRQDEGPWIDVGVLRDGDLMGSISNSISGQRELLVFRCLDDHSEVLRPSRGIDAELADGELRAIAAEEFVLIASLAAGEEHIEKVLTDRGLFAEMRFVHEA